MKKNNILEHKLADLYFDSESNLFEEKWKEGTNQATDQDYIDYQHLKLSIVSQYPVELFLCDTNNFFYTINLEMQTWTDEVVMGFWNQTNLKKLAFLVSKGLFEQVALEQAMAESTHKFPIQYFENEADALNWLLEK